MQPTPEQQECEDVFLSGDSMKINAFAGSGKTSTLKLLARAKVSPGVYLCFNKSIAEEAQKAFPETVACRTTHSFAYRQTIALYRNSGRDKMNGKAYARDVADILKLRNFPIFGATEFIEPSTQGYIINETISRFLRSADTELDSRHYAVIPKARTLPDDEFRVLRGYIVSKASEFWELMRDPQSPVPLTHDGYVKVWQLSDPVIETCYILVDEAQDTNPVMLDVLAKQMCQVVYVGDKHQQIYEWRGAINAMEIAPAKRTINLTKSFRFGQAIADFASNILATIGESVRIVGNETITSRLTTEGQKVVLCRTNGQILDSLLALDESSPEKSVHVVGGVDDLLKTIDGVERLKAGRPSSHPLFLGFKSWNDFELYADKSGDTEAAKVIKLTTKYGVSTLKSVLQNINPSEAKADVLFTTAHKSKGREWEGVELADDFREQPEKDPETEERVYNQPETRLFYVAATRAVNNLKVPAWARDIYGVVSDTSENTTAVGGM